MTSSGRIKNELVTILTSASIDRIYCLRFCNTVLSVTIISSDHLDVHEIIMLQRAWWMILACSCLPRGFLYSSRRNSTTESQDRPGWL